MATSRISEENKPYVLGLAKLNISAGTIAAKFGYTKSQVVELCNSNRVFVRTMKERIPNQSEKIKSMIESGRFSRDAIARRIGVGAKVVAEIESSLLGFEPGNKNKYNKDEMTKRAKRVFMLVKHGMTIKDACRSVGKISQATFIRYRAKIVEGDDVK